MQDKIRKQNIIITKLEQQAKEGDIEELKSKLNQIELNFKNLKKLMDFKDKIIDELLKQIQSHKLLLQDPQIQLKIKSIQDLNQKISNHLTQ